MGEKSMRGSMMMMMNNKGLWFSNHTSVTAAAFVAGSLMMVMTLVVVPWFLRPSSLLYNKDNNRQEKVFSLMVTLQFQDVTAREEFLVLVQPVIEYVTRDEPTTLAYEVLLSDKDDLQVLFLERYVDKEVAYLQIHKSSAAFLAFRPKLQAMQQAGRVIVTGNSFLDSGMGFVGRQRN
jgi:quinol monooxygenase YgiN